MMLCNARAIIVTEWRLNTSAALRASIDKLDRRLNSQAGQVATVYLDRGGADAPDAPPPLFVQCRAYVQAVTLDVALATTRMILDTLASGKRAWIRTGPEAQTEREFLTNADINRGYVRFTFLPDIAGDWELPKPEHDEALRD